MSVGGDKIVVHEISEEQGEQTPVRRIPVGISACLTGMPVRHDGGHKHSRYCTQDLSAYFDLHTFCPEHDSGLPVPRPAMHLVERGDALRMEVIKTSEDVTGSIDAWSREYLPHMSALSGFVLASKSPSCGFERVRVYSPKGDVLRRDAQGLFAHKLMQAFPQMPVEDAGRLFDPSLRENFLARVFIYDEWTQLCRDGITAKKLIEFHTRHKFQLLAQSEKTYRKLGPMLSQLNLRNGSAATKEGNQPAFSTLEELAEAYFAIFMDGMRQPSKRGSHVNVMLHLLGFFRTVLSGAERNSIKTHIEAYLRGELPLIVPISLLRHTLQRYPNDYLKNQAYLSPYPDALGLRNPL